MDQIPLPRHLPEAVLLVRVVVARRPGLHVVAVVERLEEPVEMRHRAEAEARGVERVHLRDALLAQVRRRAEVMLAGLVDERRHDLGWIRNELQAVDAGRGGLAHPLPRLGRALDRAFPFVERQAIREHPRRGDLVARAPRLLALRVRRGSEGNAATGGDAVREPELVGVLGLRGLRRLTRVQVQVHETGQHVHAFRVDLLRRALRPVAGAHVARGRVDREQRLDAVSLYDDVDGTAWRRSGAVDHGRVADDQALEGTLALGARRRRAGIRIVLLRGGCEGDAGDDAEKPVFDVHG